MKLKKGSAAAKAYMAKIRAKRKSVKKVGSVSKKVGSTLKFSSKEKRLGATDKDTKGKNYHKDTKSHNVNIRVISGISKIGAIDLNTVGRELLKLENEINELSGFIRREKSATERNRLKEIRSVKQNQFKALKGYLNTIARFK